MSRFVCRIRGLLIEKAAANTTLSAPTPEDQERVRQGWMRVGNLGVG
jgi:hypothetical protein